MQSDCLPPDQQVVNPLFGECQKQIKSGGRSMWVLVLPPLLGHLPDGLEALCRARLTPESPIELGVRLGRHETLRPLCTAPSGSFLASSHRRRLPRTATTGSSRGPSPEVSDHLPSHVTWAKTSMQAVRSR